jgi:hypothetical protein
MKLGSKLGTGLYRELCTAVLDFNIGSKLGIIVIDSEAGTKRPAYSSCRYQTWFQTGIRT